MTSRPIPGTHFKEGMPSRSLLVRQKPFGVGTPYIEGLGSYFLRLADSHSVSPGTLNTYLRSHRFNSDGLLALSYDSAVWGESCFIGLGSVARGWSLLLEKATAFPRLRNLTLLPLLGRIAVHGAIHDTRRWCPLCFQEGLEMGSPYGQLLWDLEPVTACPKHRIVLQSRCPCGSPLRFHGLRPKLLAHVCKHCGRSLGQADQESLVDAPPSAVARAASIGELLKSNLFLEASHPGGEKGVAHFLKGALNALPNCSLQRVASRTGLHKSHLSMWKNGVHLPSLGNVVLLAETFGCSLESVLIGDATAAQNPIPIGLAHKTRLRVVIAPEEMRRQLASELEENPLPSLAQIGKRLGVDRTTLSKHFIDVTKKLVTKRKQARKELTERLHQDRAEAFRVAAKKLANQGIRPTQNRVWAALGKESAVFAPVDRDACRRACREAILGMQGPG